MQHTKHGCTNIGNQAFADLKLLGEKVIFYEKDKNYTGPFAGYPGSY